jgi:hypothetical protein
MLDLTLKIDTSIVKSNKYEASKQSYSQQINQNARALRKGGGR